jgi:hypothetical protein
MVQRGLADDDVQARAPLIERGALAGEDGGGRGLGHRELQVQLRQHAGVLGPPAVSVTVRTGQGVSGRQVLAESTYSDRAVFPGVGV